MSRFVALTFALALVVPGLASAEDEATELTTEQLEALRKFKRKRIRVQDVQITTTYVRGGVSTGSSTRFSWRITGGGEDAMNTMQFIDAIDDTATRKKYVADEKKDMALFGVGMGAGGGILGAGAVLAGVFGSQMQAALDSAPGYVSSVDLDSCDLYYEDSPGDLAACNQAASFQPGAIAGGVLLATGGTIMGVAGYLTALFRIQATWPGKYYSKDDAFEAVDQYNYELARELGFSEAEAKALLLSRIETRRPTFEARPAFALGFVGITGRF